jgi:hypothetical protein
MARLARVIAVGVPHHITQRGNARRFILQDESDRKVYTNPNTLGGPHHSPEKKTTVAALGYMCATPTATTRAMRPTVELQQRSGG